MTYGEVPFDQRLKRLREAYLIGVTIIGALLTTAFVFSEIKRILELPSKLTNYLYLALLVSTLLLVGGWVVFARVDLDALAEWLDPENYQPPSEILTVTGIALMLVMLIISTRSIVLFGFAYVSYAAINLLASSHMRKEFRVALGASRARLSEDRKRPELAVAVQNTEKALTALERYILVRPNLRRIAAVLFLATAGLSLSLWRRAGGSEMAKVAAYGLYIFAILVPDSGIMLLWRQSLERELRPLAATRHELLRNKTPNRPS